ncbi:MAG: hypothetical protein WCC87_05030 [Candidatus Korobacteraceae bacterium]
MTLPASNRWVANQLSQKRTLMPTKQDPPAPTVHLDHILTSVVVVNWEALTSSSPTARIRMEYHIGTDGSIEYLKLWMSAREYWSLICDYSIHPGWSDGPRFSNGYHSRSLGRLLQSIMMNQKLFGHGCEPDSNRLLEIGTPTLQQTDEARLQVSETFQGSA